MSRVIDTDTDFAPTYSEINHNPLYYLINVCPFCGYSYNEKFTNRFPFKAKEQISENITRQWNQTNMYGQERTSSIAIASYKLALLSATSKQETSLVIGGICLRLAWLYRMDKNREQEHRFMRYALAEYKKAQTKFEVLDSSMSEIKLMYLLGELQRRLGNADVAISYFKTVVKYKDMSTEQDVITFAEEFIQKYNTTFIAG